MIEQLSIDIRLFAQPQSVSCEKLLQNIFCKLAGLAGSDNRQRQSVVSYKPDNESIKN